MLNPESQLEISKLFNDSQWANCATPDCPNKVCTWSNDFLCFPCHKAIVGLPEMIKRWNETHDEPWSDNDNKSIL